MIPIAIAPQVFSEPLAPDIVVSPAAVITAFSLMITASWSNRSAMLRLQAQTRLSLTLKIWVQGCTL